MAGCRGWGKEWSQGKAGLGCHFQIHPGPASEGILATETPPSPSLPSTMGAVSTEKEVGPRVRVGVWELTPCWKETEEKAKLPEVPTSEGDGEGWWGSGAGGLVPAGAAAMVTVLILTHYTQRAQGQVTEVATDRVRGSSPMGVNQTLKGLVEFGLCSNQR